MRTDGTELSSDTNLGEEKVKKLKIQAAFMAVALFCAACGAATNSNTTASNTSTPAAATPASQPTTEVAKALSGKDLYTVHCMTCHKDSGKGGKVTVDGKQLDPDDLTSATMKAKTDEKLYSYISDGIVDEGMPSFKNDLKPDEIKAVVAHLRELQGN